MTCASVAALSPSGIPRIGRRFSGERFRLSHRPQCERRPSGEVRQPSRIQGVVRVRSDPATRASPSLERPRRLDCGREFRIRLSGLRRANRGLRHDNDQGTTTILRVSTTTPSYPRSTNRRGRYAHGPGLSSQAQF